MARFEVIVRESVPPARWRIEVTEADGGEFAAVEAGSLEVALRMAVPYMASAAQPDPFLDVLKANAAHPGGSLAEIPVTPEEDEAFAERGT
jgi:hypothetical protein